MDGGALEMIQIDYKKKDKKQSVKKADGRKGDISVMGFETHDRRAT